MKRIVLAAGAALLLAVLASRDRFLLQLFSKMMITSIFAISLDLLVGFAGLTSLAHAAFFGLAAYLLVGLTGGLGISQPLFTLPLTLAGAAVGALVIGWLSLRAAGVYFIMVTLAFTQMLFYLFNEAPGLGGSDGLYLSQRPISDPRAVYLAIWCALALSYLFLSRLVRAPFGRVLIGIRENEQRTRSLGYAVQRYKLAAFVIAGTLSGLCGYLDATLYGFVNPALFGWRQSGAVLVMVLLGGKGTLHGPVLGAFALTLLETYGERVTTHWNALVAVLVMAVVLFMPRGLAGALRDG